ncbi:AAA family ATPase [Flavobacteriaceae bacterium Ap0902]|nr:AAA family ATPase [Flavobacteriaceae bacterium Ap0902]
MVKQSKKKYTIPKGYKGISNTIVLEFNTQLAVITGLNGSGKSTMLKYLYENYPDRSKCFIKTPQNTSLYNIERRKLLYNRNSSDELSFDSVMQRIEEIGFGRRGRIDSPFLEKTDFYSSLFDENSLRYEVGYKFLEMIADLLANYQLEDINYIKRELGVVTDNDVEKELVKHLNLTKDSNLEYFGYKRGRKIIEKYNSLELDNEKINFLNRKKKLIEENLKKEFRSKAKIKSEQALKQYVYDLITKEFRSIESIVLKMSNKIFEDFKTKSSKTKTKKLWENINAELKKYYDKGYFKYKLVPPQIYESYYEIAFKPFDKPANTYIHYDSLSSGEKIIFELICYYFAAQESKLEMIMLDEFDANLNPQLAERYIKVIKEQFKNIKVVLTTHSPSTVVEVEPNELYELTDSRELKCAYNQDGKRDILKRLAPKFVYHGEFGILEDVFNEKYELIVFLEGKNDVKNFEKGLHDEKYKFIDSNGVGNMPNLVTIFKAMPFFRNLAKQKKIIFLFDFDEDGIQNLSKCLNRGISGQDVFGNFTNKDKYISKIDNDMNLYVSHLIPSKDHSWKINNVYRHQELNREGVEGIERQFDNLKDILENY